MLIRKDFDEAKAEMGITLFFGKANCVACHESAEGTGDKGYFTHIVENPPQGLLAIGIKTPGLRGLAYTAPYFHDGRQQHCVMSLIATHQQISRKCLIWIMKNRRPSSST